MNARLSSARSDDELLSSFVRAAVLFLKILYLFLFIIIISIMKSKTTLLRDIF